MSSKQDFIVLPVKTGLCSYGMSGKVFHAPLLSAHKGFELQSVWQRSKNDAQSEYPHVNIVRSLEAMLEDENLELIVVNTPEPTHFDYCKAALKAGKHVVVEKAFTTTVAEAEKLVEIARENQKILSVYQNRRWDGDFLTVQKILREGLLGRVVEYEAHYDRYRTYIQESWKEVPGPGKGLLYNLGAHLIDQALVLFGMPEQVYADLEIQRTGGRIQDYFQLHLYYEGMKAILKSSYLVREPGPRYRILGESGSFHKWGLDPQEEALKKGGIPGNDYWGQEAEADWGHLLTETNGLLVNGRISTIAGNYMAYYDNIFQAIRFDAPLAVPAEAGVAVMKVIHCAEESAKEGRRIDF